MYVLDENIPARERDELNAWRIHVRQVGIELARKGTSDENVIPALHKLRAVTFFTRDVDYYRPRLCHARYCLVFIDVDDDETAEMIWRFLRHRAFRTWSQRKGTVVGVSDNGMRVWRLNAKKVELIPW